MISFSNEHSLSLRQAAELLPGHPKRSTMHRWTHQGVRGVRLATFLVGGRRYTTPEAIEAFIRALSERGRDDDA